MTQKMHVEMLVAADFKDGTPAAEKYFGRDHDHNVWVLSELDRYEAMARAGTLSFGPTLEHGDWVYADQLPRIGQARLAAQKILATETTRGYLNWQWVYDNIFVPQYVRAMEQWVFDHVRKGDLHAKVTMVPYLVISDKTNLWMMNGVPHPLPCAVVPEGYGIDDNRVKEAAAPAVPDFDTPNWKWNTVTSYDGRQSGRMMIVKVGGGGHAGGRGPYSRYGTEYALHPEYFNTGFGTWGAEPWLRYAILGVPDPCMALVCWPSQTPAAGAHEYIGHSCGVLLHPNDHTGVSDGDWTTLQEVVTEKNDYPLDAGEFYLEAQQDEFRKANEDFIEWVAVDPPPPPIGGDTTPPTVPPVEPLGVAPMTISLRVGQSATIEASKPSTFQVIAGTKNAAASQVDLDTGRVTGKKQGGATVRVRAGNEYKDIPVSIRRF